MASQTRAVSPSLYIQQISDQFSRNNFQNLQNYFQANNQLLGFSFFEINVGSATTNASLSHNLGYLPKDIITTLVSGPGILTWNFSSFTTTTLNYSTTDAIRVRFFIGTYYADTSTVQFASTDKQLIMANPAQVGSTATAAATTTTTTSSSTTNTTQLFVTNNSQTGTFYPLFVNTSTTGLKTVYTSPTISMNPFAGSISATTFVGALSGNATTATTATNANDIQTTASSTNASFYLVAVPLSTTGYQAPIVNSGVSVNPSTATITASIFVGSLTGGASLDLPLTGGTMSGAISMGTNQIHSVVDPVSAQDAATKNYVDTVASGLNPIQAVTAATIGSNIPGTYVQVGGGIGDTFTITSTATFTIDGITPSVGQRILFKDQTSGQQNGVYNLTTLANVGILGAIFTRSLDYDTVADVNAGDLIPVINGTVNAKTSWLQTATVTSVGSSGTPLVFAEWTANPANYLLKANNLSDVSSASTALSNLGGLSNVLASGDFFVGNVSNVAAGVAMSGDATLANTGAVTLATVNSNIGSYTNASITVNAKGLVTAASTGSGGSSTTGNYFSGYMPSATSWSRSNAAYADPSNSGNNTLTTRVSNGITVTAASSNLPGVVFTPAASTSIYWIQASFLGNCSGSGPTLNCRLIDSNGVVIADNGAAGSTGAILGGAPFNLCGPYAPATASAVTVKIQMSNTAGTGNISDSGGLSPSIEWKIFQMS